MRVIGLVQSLRTLNDNKYRKQKQKKRQLTVDVNGLHSHVEMVGGPLAEVPKGVGGMQTVVRLVFR
jgi:hypothetical protein